MTDPQFAPSWEPFGIQILDGDDLVGVVVNVPFSDSVETVADLIGTEVGADRLDATGASVRGDTGWTLFLDDITSTSTAVDSEGVWWATDGATDADRKLIAFGPNPLGPTDPYEPTWDSGLIFLPFASVGQYVTGVQAGTNVTVDNTDPQRPIVSASGGGGGGSGQVGTDRLTPDDGDTVALSTTVARVIRLPDTTSATITFTAPAPTATPPFWVELVRGTQAFDTYTFHWPGDVYDPFGLLAADSGAASIAVLVIPSTDGVDPYLQIRLLPLDGGVITADTVDSIVAAAIADGGYASTSDITDAITALGLGTAATKNVAASGNAASGEVVKGNDTRLSDSRTPSAHKTSHATGGSDALAPSDIGAVPTSRQLAGLDLTADRTAPALRTALSLVPGTDVQAYDADLAAVAALTTDSFGLALLTKTSSAAIRTYLGLVLGTDVQAYHANLAALAGLSLVADRLPYANGTGTLALATFTASGRTLVSQASLAAALGQLSGQAAADFAWNSHKLTGVTPGTAATDVATVGQVGYVSTAVIATTTIVTTSAETTAFTAALPTDLAAGDLVELYLFGDRSNSSGSTSTTTLRLKLGSTTLLTSSAISTTSVANRAGWTLAAQLVVEVPASAQRTGAMFATGTPAATSWTPIAASNTHVGSSPSTEDLTSAKNLVFTVQMSVANAATDFVVLGGALKIARKR